MRRPCSDQARRVTRILRGILRRQRAIRIGPDLSHRRTIVAQVLRARAVRAVVAAEARDKHDEFRPGLLQARKYAFEIAANYSHAFVQIAEKLLGRVWNRVYDGVKINHAGTLKDVSEGNEVVYVPCHRSHMDYLLMSYIIYHQGYALPHIAAGINLNIPVVGPLPAQGRRVLHPPQLRRQRAVHRGLHEVPRRHHGARPLHRIFHRGRALAHRAAAAAEDRHVVDDGAQLPARPGAARWCSCRCTSATSASSRPTPTSPSCRARPRRRRAGSTCCSRCACCASASAPCT